MKKFEGKGTLTVQLNRTGIYYNLGQGESCYNSFGQENNNPHYQLWIRINLYLKRRGFKVTLDPKINNEQFSCLNKDHKYGIKRRLEYTTHRYPNGFEFTFFQSIMFENQNGGQYDFDKYEKMPYLIKLSYRNEAMRLAKFAESIGVNVKIEKQLSDIEEIIKSNNDNLHVHGKIECLDDLKELMKSYHQGSNSQDKNKKLVTCGDTKYFYDYHKKIARGIAYHNINNMWWMIVNGKRYNICVSELFDFYPGIPKKKPLSYQQKIQRIHTELKKAEESQNYERCIVLRNILKPVKLYNVWSKKHDCYWRPNNAGYTSDKSAAGVYTEETINNSPNYYNNEDTKTILIN